MKQPMSNPISRPEIEAEAEVDAEDSEEKDTELKEVEEENNKIDGEEVGENNSNPELNSDEIDKIKESMK
mgnify:CR=1 FL=1